jgi:phage-related protein
MTATAIDAQSGLDRRAIESWLLGHNTYKKLQIDQDDIANCYYNVIFTGASIKYVGNIMRGIVLSAECDAPWAWTFPKYLRYNFSGDQIKDFDFNFFNESDDNGYLYPITTFTLNSIGNSFQITNYSDDNRIFLLEGLQPNETITIDNCNKTITSSTGLYRLDAFNKNWLRLKKGNNLMHLTSGIGTFTMECSFPRAIGG